MKLAIYPFILAISLAAGSAAGADTSREPTPEPADPAVEQYKAASARQDWGAAASAMRDGLSRNAGNADFHNLYAYALRKGGSSNMDLVFKHYNEALRIDSKHRGAHEYIGEAYLMVGNVAKAKEHLGALDKLCFFKCAELTDLKKAISEYESRSAKR